MCGEKHPSLIVVLTCVLLMAGHAMAAKKSKIVRLSPQSIISSEKIRLGDVVEQEEALPEGLADLPLGNAPWAGRVRKVDAALIELRLVAAGYDRIPFEIGGSDVCLVKRKTREISSEQIIDVAREYLMEQLPEEGVETSVELLNDVHAVQLADDGNRCELRPEHRAGESLWGRCRINVHVVQDGKRIETEPVIFRVALYKPVAVAREPIGISKKISNESVIWKRRDLGSIRGTCVTQKAQLANMVANRTISPGQVITTNMLKAREQPVCVEPQQLVNLIVETGKLRVVVRGRALEQGRKGDVITAVNDKTGRKVSGVVVSDGNIRVKM